MAKSLVIITGASSGMGMEFALQLDAHLRKTDEIWLIARDTKKLKKLGSMLRNNHKILTMDLTKDGQMERLQDTLKDEHGRIRILVNCAGFGVIGNAADIDAEEQANMVRLNCEALTRVTLTCLPYMVKGSRIIQMASSAAFMPQPGFAVYAASKSYVDSFSMALRAECHNKGICVTSVCPGPVDTPFFTIAERGGKKLAIKELCMAYPDLVVSKALWDSIAMQKSRSVYSLPIQAFQILAKIVPHNVMVQIVKRLKED